MAVTGLETTNYKKRLEERDYKKRLNKVMTEKDAVATFLPDGGSFTVGGFIAVRTSDCVFREVARQGKKNLSYIEESPGFALDTLIGLGAIDRVDLSYWAIRQLGGLNGMPCVEVCLKEGVPRPIKMGGVMETKPKSDPPPVEVVDWTNFEVGLRFVAGAFNIPFIPCRSSLGGDIPKYNKDIKVINDPYENKPILLIPAYKPDVAFISVQRADRRGNGQIWGFKGVDFWKARAAKHTVLLTEELVPTEKIYENAGLTTIPAYCTDAVVLLPYNCHPSEVYGCYHGDMLRIVSNMVACQTHDAFLKWLDEWVYGCKDNSDYCDKIGWECLDRLAKAEHVINRIPE